MANNNKNTLWKVKIIVEYYFSIKIYVKLLNKGKCVYIIICVREHCTESDTIGTLTRFARYRLLRDVHKNRVSRVTFSKGCNQSLMISASRKPHLVNRGIADVTHLFASSQWLWPRRTIKKKTYTWSFTVTISCRPRGTA